MKSSTFWINVISPTEVIIYEEISTNHPNCIHSQFRNPFSLQSNVLAATQYSSKRSQEVKLIWRKSMKQHAFTAPTGARFSKHLGTRYGSNTETANVIWYTDAHEKLYLKNLHMYSIYYHVTNQNQNLQGWIWKGYMEPISNSSSSSTSGKTRIDNAHQSLNDRVQDVLSLFLGTKYSKSASEYIDTDPEAVVQNPDPRTTAQKQSSISIMHSTTLDNNVPAIQQLKANKITFKQYVANDLKKQSINPENYSGYTIGISCSDELGDYSVLLYK